MLATAAAIRCTVAAWQGAARNAPTQLTWASGDVSDCGDATFSPAPSDEADDEDRTSSH